MFWTRVVLWRENFVLYDRDDFILPIKRGVQTRNKVLCILREKGVLI